MNIFDDPDDDTPMLPADTPESVLASSRVPALRALRAIVTSDLCPTCGRGRDSSATIRAAEALLNRAGVGPSATLHVDHDVQITKIKRVIVYPPDRDERRLGPIPVGNGPSAEKRSDLQALPAADDEDGEEWDLI